MTYTYDPEYDPYKRFHRITSETNIAKDIQHTGGKATLINGDVFYSPNSTAQVGLPPPVENNSSIWRDSGRSSPREFHQPLWWSEVTAYLAFLPLYPEECGEPFGELLNVPRYYKRFKEGYRLDPAIVVKWKKLQWFLERIAHLLSVPSHAPTPRKIINTALSCLGYCKDLHDLRRDVRRSRDWFSVWMAHVSYMIALAISVDPPEPDTVPKWCHYLLRSEFAQAGWDQAYIAGVRQSMGNYSPSVLRAGIFLQIVSPPRHQFSVDWFQRFHVPVWYPWGQREMNAAIASRQVGRLAPRSEALQALATFLSKQPEIPVGRHEDDSTRVASEKQQPLQKPWVAFLAERARRTKCLIDRETPQERQKRENRERNPPKRRVKVYIWEEDRNSKDGYRRVLVSQQNNEYYLDDFSSTQKVYNAIFNEWDCCEEMGDEKSDSDAGSDFNEDYDDDLTNVHDSTTKVDYPEFTELPSNDDFLSRSLSTTSTTSNSASSGSSNLQASSLNQLPTPFHSSPPSRKDPDYELDFYDAFELLQDFLGYVPSLPLPTRVRLHERLSENQVKTLIALVGLRAQRDECFSNLVEVWDFLEAFDKSDALCARTQIWDLAFGNRLYLKGCQRLRYLSVLDGEKSGERQEKLYCFDFGQDATVPWLLAVTNVIDALFVCRLPRKMDDYHIVKHLLTRGIRFRTLLPAALPPPRDLPTIFTPFRLSGYVFNSRDYDVYIREREALLRNPRIARAALMKGGVIWRLVVASVSPSDVLSGPTAAISLHNYGLALGESEHGQHLWDDFVSPEELDQICGTYFCYTGKLYLS
jgi:hypothetical protein